MIWQILMAQVKQIKSIRNFFSNKINLKILLELKNILKISGATIINRDGILLNKTFMLTGKLEGMIEAKAKSLVKKFRKNNKQCE